MNANIIDGKSARNESGGSAPTGQPEVVNTSRGNRERFLDACHCRAVDRPPVWLMRQAGRALPEYRALKEKYTFLQLVQTRTSPRKSPCNPFAALALMPRCSSATFS